MARRGSQPSTARSLRPSGISGSAPRSFEALVSAQRLSLFCSGAQCLQLRLGELRREVLKRVGLNADPALEQRAERRRDPLHHVDLVRAHLELLRHAIPDEPAMVRELGHDLLARDDGR